MCRLAAYMSPQIPLENIVTAPRHSLLFQSKDAYEFKVSTNGDGFGIASEPLDNRHQNWVAIMPSRIVSASADGVVLERALNLS